MEVLLVWYVYGGVVSLAFLEVLLVWHVYGGVVSLACIWRCC